MFTPKRNAALGLSTGAAATPNSANRVTRSQSLKTRNELFCSPGGGSGNTSMANRSILNTSNLYNDAVLESYKSSLPIKVHEIISQLKHQDSSQVSASILPNGHVCFIHDRKVYLWKLKKALKNIQCYELTLPSSSRAPIRPECISVECHNNRDYVAICVTAEGIIRYWPTILKELLCVDAKFDLANGDEVVNVTCISENFYLIITANGTLWSCHIDSNDGKILPVCRRIDSSSSLFSSVSRRMTSLIFGGSQLNKNNQNFKCSMKYPDSNEIYCLVDKNLEKWRINSDSTLSLVTQMNVERLFSDNYLMQSPDSVRFNLALHHGSITRNSIYILAIFEDDGLKFTVGEIDTKKFESKLKSFHILNYNINSNDMQTLYHIHAMDNQHALYIYNSNLLVSFTGPTFDMNGESRFNIMGDRLLASNFYDSELVFFSLTNGILKTRDNSPRFSLDEESFHVENTSFANAHMSSVLNATASNVTTDHFNASSIQNVDDLSFTMRGASRQSLDMNFSNLMASDQSMVLMLKEAFQCYLKKDERNSENIADELLRNTLGDRKIDFYVNELSEKLIDDMPAHDPRWAEMNPKGKSLNTNLIISNQLKGKIRLHEYYLSFLRKFGVWDKLTYVNYNGRDILTHLALQEHGEKLQMALMIREQLYSKNPDFVNSAIEFTTKNRADSASKHVYPHDIFYRKVSKIDEIFNSLFCVLNDVIKANSNEQAINYLIDCVSFYNKLLKTCQLYRLEKAKMYESTHVAQETRIEFIRWTFLPLKEMTKTQAILSLAVKQHKLCSEYGLLNCNSSEKKSIILQQLAELDSLIFDEYKARLLSIQPSGQTKNDYANLKKSYDQLKTKLIEVYIKQKQIDTAIRLAEQYVDFNTLIMICELRNDLDLLESYLNKFENTKFVEDVVKYVMDKRKLSFLLKNQFLRRRDISDCLDRYQEIAWIKDFKNEQYHKASRVLANLATNDAKYFMQQKSLVSLSKLSLIANGDYDQREMNALNRKLDYLAYTENLPADVIKKLSLDVNHLRVYKPEDLLRLYITYEEATQIEFKKAMEIIDYFNDDKTHVYAKDQLDEIRVEILASSILADKEFWEQLYEEDYPEKKLCDTKFYKTMFLIKKSGDDYESILNLKDKLINHDSLELLNQSDRLSYLVQVCLEQLSY